MNATDDLVLVNRRYAASFDAAAVPPKPRLGLAVLACMDVRFLPSDALGLSVGDAHLLRNAGGIATDDALRSLVVSQRKLGTREVAVIAHTDCGMLTFRDEEFAEQLRRETGVSPDFAFGAFADLEASVRSSVERIRNCPFLPYTDAVRGFVYDVGTGLLSEVEKGVDPEADPELSTNQDQHVNPTHEEREIS